MLHNGSVGALAVRALTFGTKALCCAVGRIAITSDARVIAEQWQGWCFCLTAKVGLGERGKT
jgi:hypothetical protein